MLAFAILPANREGQHAKVVKEAIAVVKKVLRDAEEPGTDQCVRVVDQADLAVGKVR